MAAFSMAPLQQSLLDVSNLSFIGDVSTMPPTPFSKLNQQVQSLSPYMHAYQTVYEQTMQDCVRPFLSISQSNPLSMQNTTNMHVLKDPDAKDFIKRNMKWLQESISRLHARYHNDEEHFASCIGRLKSVFSRMEFRRTTFEDAALEELQSDALERINSLMEDQERIRFAIESTGSYHQLTLLMSKKEWTKIQCPSLAYDDHLVCWRGEEDTQEQQEALQIKIDLLILMYCRYRKTVNDHAKYFEHSLYAYRQVRNIITYVQAKDKVTSGYW